MRTFQLSFLFCFVLFVCLFLHIEFYSKMNSLDSFALLPEIISLTLSLVLFPLTSRMHSLSTLRKTRFCSVAGRPACVEVHVGSKIFKYSQLIDFTKESVCHLLVTERSKV